jgi:membrane protease YdiL (CAAX protease family)
MKSILNILIGLVVFAILSFLKSVADNIGFVEVHNLIKNSVTIIYVLVICLMVILGNKVLNHIAYSNSSLSFDKFISNFAIGIGFCLLLITATASVMALIKTPLPVMPGGFVFFISLIFSSLLISVFEEFFFRGFISQVIYVAISNVLITSIIGSSIFLLFHLNLVIQGDLPFLYLINIFAGGILLNYLFFLYKSIWVPIGYHFVYNLFWKIFINEDELINHQVEWIFTIGLIIMTGIFVVRVHSKKMTAS